MGGTQELVYAGDSQNTCRCGRARSSAIQQNARIILLAANGRAVEPLRADLVELAQPFAWHGRYIHTKHVSVNVVPPSFAAVRVVLPAPVEDLEVWSSPGLRSARSFEPRCPRCAGAGAGAGAGTSAGADARGGAGARTFRGAAGSGIRVGLGSQVVVPACTVYTVHRGQSPRGEPGHESPQ